MLTRAPQWAALATQPSSELNRSVRMRHRVMPYLLVTIAACDGDDASSPGPDTAPLPITAAQIDSARTLVAPVFSDPMLRVLLPSGAEDGNLRAQRRPDVDPGSAIIDPVTSAVVPTTLRGRRLTFVVPAGWTSAPDPTVPANGVAIALYPGSPFAVEGPTVGTLTVLDSSTTTHGVAVLTARNLAGVEVLRARITQAISSGEIISSATIGSGPTPSATLADTLGLGGSFSAGRITMAGGATAWYFEGLLEIDGASRVELVFGPRVLTARTVARAAGGDSTSFTIDGRFIGALTTSRTVVGAANTNAQGVIDAASRFAGSVPIPNLFGVLVTLLLLTVRGP
ncbi:MAG: hypothetical protein ACK53W_11535 [Gemmatimonadota bacterium]